MLKSESPKFLCALVLSVAAVFGAPTIGAAKTEKNKNRVETPVTDTVSLLDEAEYEKLMAKAKKESGTRGIAEVDRIDEATAVADDLKNFIVDLQGGYYWKNNKQLGASLKAPAAKKSETSGNPFTPVGLTKNEAKDPNYTEGVKSAEDLAAMIVKYEANYATLSPAAKIAAAQLIALKPYRGILYRLRPIAEAQDTPAIHGLIISYLRSVNAGLNNLYPSDQGQAGFDYFARPYPNMPATIKDEAGLYNFVAVDALKSQLEFASRVAAIPLDKPVYLDNKVFWDKAKFVTDKDRFQLVGNAEKYAYLSAICGNISSIYGSVAYDWTDLFKATQGFWMVYGFNTISQPDNMTAEQRTKKIKKYGDLFTLRPNGQTWTKHSYDWFIRSLKYARLSWQIIKSEQNRGSSTLATTFLDPRGFLPFTRTINTTFANIDELVHGKPGKDGRVVKQIASAVVAGEVVDVDLKQISENPPKDLKAFLPTEFVEGSRELEDAATGLKYRNYNRGNPKAWNVGEYQKFFPGVRSDEDVKRTARVLSQSWGGGLLGFPFATVLF